MSFEMADNHFMFLVTLPIHVEAMTVRRHPYNREEVKNIYFYDLNAIFVRKLQKSHLNHG